MTADPFSPPTHPLAACVAEIEAALDGVATVNPGYAPTPVKASVLVGLARLEERLRGLKLRVLANADDVALDSGARSAGAWLAHETRATYGATLAAERLGTALEHRWQAVGAALLEGRVNAEQARVIVTALDALPGDLEAETRAKAEAHLVAEAAHFDAKRLRVLGRRVLDVIAPEVGEAEEQRQLEAEEARARRHTSLTMRTRGDGSTDIAIRVPDSVASRLKTFLEAYASPRRGRLDQWRDQTDPATGARIPRSTLMGRAFCSMLESMSLERLPRHGGSATTVVTINEQQLRDQMGAAGLGTGGRISAGEALRLACNAGIMPMVLGGQGEPLHLGRKRRLFSSAQRIAMGVRDRRCRTAGCEIPAAWCEAHHLQPWCRGGRTDIDDGILLCSWHHHRAHDSTYAMTTPADGDVRFHRRT